MATEKDEMDLLLSEKERKIGDKKVVVPIKKEDNDNGN